MRNKKFEVWFARIIEEPTDRVFAMWNGATYESRTWHVELAWASWCAALGFES